MKQIIQCAVLSWLIVTVSPAIAEFRTWTGNNGVSLEAEFVRLKGDGTGLVLRRRDGSLIHTKTYNLTAGDQKHVADNIAASRALQSAQGAVEDPESAPALPSQRAEGMATTARQRGISDTSRRPQPAVLPKNRWHLDNDDEQAVVVEEPVDQNHWQRPKRDLRGAQLHEVAPLDDPDLGRQDQWGLQQGGKHQQPNLQHHRQNALNQMQDPLQHDAWNHGTHDSQDQTDQWRKQQEQEERWQRQQEEQRVQMEKDMIKSRAFQLEGRIRDSRHSSHADYSGMSTEAEFLSQDASRLGESGAAWQFGNAASKLREMEREDNSLWNRQQDSFGSQGSFGSQFDSNRREAERDVWGGSGSINSFDSGSSMDSW